MTDQPGDNPLGHLPLGKEVEYPQVYDASLLCPISRQTSRQLLGLDNQVLPFGGVDIWNAYELSWLNTRGKPLVAQAEFHIPADSPAMIESKSFKLYLNSFNQHRLEGESALVEVLARDLSTVAGAPVGVRLIEADDAVIERPGGHCLDTQDIAISQYRMCPELLSCAGNEVQEQVYSHLLRSLCPVTGQPDWATLVIQYQGRQIDHEGLLRYIVGYRLHQEFHEQCVERIFRDIQQACKPQSLLVYARYLRRGGLDINPYRSSDRHFYDMSDSACAGASIHSRRLGRQ